MTAMQVAIPPGYPPHHTALVMARHPRAYGPFPSIVRKGGAAVENVVRFGDC